MKRLSGGFRCNEHLKKQRECTSVNTDEFYYPRGIALAEEALIVADSFSDRIRLINDSDNMNIKIGKPGGNNISYATSGGYVDGYLEDAEFFVADTMNHSIRHIFDGETRTILGNGQAEKFYGSAENIRLSKPSAITSDGTDLYISDSLNNNVIVVPLTLEQDYFMEKNIAVIPFDELTRLFPYSFEYFPEFNVIAVTERLKERY